MCFQLRVVSMTLVDDLVFSICFNGMFVDCGRKAGYRDKVNPREHRENMHMNRRT